MSEKSLEELTAWVKDFNGPNCSNARGVVACIRKQKDPRECWLWIQGLLRDPMTPVRHIASLLAKEEGFSQYQPLSVTGGMYSIKKGFLGLGADRSLTAKQTHAKRKSAKSKRPVKLSSGVTPPKAAKEQPASPPPPAAKADDTTGRILAVLDLGLSPDVLKLVIRDIVATK